MRIISIILFSILFFMEPSNAQLSVNLEKGKVYELVLFSVEEGKFEQLLNNYLPKVLPLVSEYDAKPLVSFSVAHSMGVEASPQIISIWEWPTPEAFARASNDERIQAILPIRNDALAFIDEANFFAVAKTTTLTLNKDEHYTLFANSDMSSKDIAPLLSLQTAEKSNNTLTWEHVVLVKQSDGNTSAKATFTLNAIIQ